ncbi:MAG: NAD(P)-dependent oxidoreductase [Chitinivibrionales bacterium]|nr:NAD(P)-dependent oxidoreductase [Chitinivibrionales bacterium]
MKKVIVTGASGFIGRCAIRHLIRRGYEVHALYHSPTFTDRDKAARWHVCDLLDAAKTKKTIKEIKPTHLLHFAWYAVPGKYWTAIDNLYWLQASLHLTETFITYGGTRLVAAGTCSEYGWTDDLCSEYKTPTNPTSLYGTCKGALQRVIDQLSSDKKISCAWGRIFFPFGPHENLVRLIPSVVLALIKKEEALCTHGNQVRDFLYVDEVAAAFVALLDSEVQGPVNIASGVPVTLKEIIYIIGDLLGNAGLIKLNAVIPAQPEPPRIVADITRLQTEVGWRQTTDLEEGISTTIAFWRNTLKTSAA